MPLSHLASRLKHASYHIQRHFHWDTAPNCWNGQMSVKLPLNFFMKCLHARCIGNVRLRLTVQSMTTPLLWIIVNNEQSVLLAELQLGTYAFCICHQQVTNHDLVANCGWQETDKRPMRDRQGAKASAAMRARTQPVSQSGSCLFCSQFPNFKHFWNLKIVPQN